MQLNARGGVVGQARALSACGSMGKMIFNVLRVERRDVELFHEGDHLSAAEIAEGVAGQA